MPILVSFLWHMHQPYYKDPVRNSYVMPWAYLHGTKDYLGMVDLAAEFPAVHQTFNLVPSLIVQLEEYAHRQVNDPMLELVFKPAEDLDETERALVLERLFPVPVRTMIDPFPRYRELFDRRNRSEAFSEQDFRDVQVWWSLVWFDEDRRPRDLVDKGKNFSIDDQSRLRTHVFATLGEIVPAYRRRQDEKTIEISTTPFYHPILPLLIDSRVDDPNVPIHFQFPEDAKEQLSRARSFMEARFGKAPPGLWPSEGSVSDAVAALAAEAGFRWAATDEGILAKSGTPVHDHERHRLYHPYHRGNLTVFFRDRHLSDLIGFHYMHQPARDAASDLIRKLKQVPAEGHVTIALDGENPWDYYPSSGRDFLRFLYEGICSDPELEAVTLSEACDRIPATRLDWLAPGSWAGGHFSIWIGHHEDHEAWEWIVRARAALMEKKGQISEQNWHEAYEELLVAEGSDWMWWFGNDFSSDSDSTFDALFRQHIGNIYHLIGLSPPPGLDRAIKKSAGERAVMVKGENS